MSRRTVKNYEISSSQERVVESKCWSCSKGIGEWSRLVRSRLKRRGGEWFYKWSCQGGQVLCKSVNPVHRHFGDASELLKFSIYKDNIQAKKELVR